MKSSLKIPFVYNQETEEDRQRQTRLFTDIPLLNAALDAIPVGMVGLNRKLQIVIHNQGFLDLISWEIPDRSDRSTANADAAPGVAAGAEAADTRAEAPKAAGPEASGVLGKRIGESLCCLFHEDTPEGCGTSEHCPKCGALQSIFASLSGSRDTRECQITQIRQGRIRSLDLRVTSVPIRVLGEDFTLFSLIDISHEKRRRALEKIFFHDVLNTASQIQRGSQLARMAGNNDPRNLDVLEALAAQLVSEIRGQRDLLAAEDNELSIHPVPLDSLQLLQDIQRQLTHPAISQGQAIEIDPGSRRVTFISDPSLIQRVLTNMVRNALEATRPGETIVLGCREVEGKQIEFRVQNPSYMPRDVQLQIFQRSFSTKGRDRGLGTYSMRLLSEQYLKGQVTFTSSRERGTVFIARYPLNILKDGYSRP